MNAFRKAVEAQDTVAMEACLADDVVFTSPVAFAPYPGKPLTAAILRGVMRVFENFRYEREIIDGQNHALVFRTEVNGKEIQGCDFLHLNEDGLIDEFTVMVRPLSGAQALSEAMAAQFEQIKAEALGSAK
ncbi:nuclear transport factor 2 family protein [Lentzea terrae]|uniref:nuclear transport factor 2 family protein n=1 Tax=Lentzea terrae TaxID=2200761 RepID=UPI000DD4AEE3|nr:nuclear transport factor 2 family protein [Lentzea terrae]